MQVLISGWLFNYITWLFSKLSDILSDVGSILLFKITWKKKNINRTSRYFISSLFPTLSFTSFFLSFFFVSFFHFSPLNPIICSPIHMSVGLATATRGNSSDNNAQGKLFSLPKKP